MMLPDPEVCRRLAESVVAARKWQWYAGMVTTEYGRVLDAWVTNMWTGKTERILGTVAHMEDPEDVLPLPDDARPDFTDPLTAAGALPVCRMAWNDPGLHCTYRAATSNFPAGWDVWCRGELVTELHPTELEALVVAILAAPVADSLAPK